MPIKGRALLRYSLVAFLLLACGCQLAHRRAVTLVNDRREKLKSLSRWSPTTCRVRVQLTQPALEHYKRLYPKEKKTIGNGVWPFVWTARESSCEVKAEAADKKADKNRQAILIQKGLLETALCTLLQVHFVNSPFDEMKVSGDQVSLQENWVAIRAKPDADFGIFMPTEQFLVETRTKSRGTFKATYAPAGRDWLPSVLELRSGTTVLALSDFVYEESRDSERRRPQSVWLEVGEERALRQAQLFFENCEPQ